MPENLQFYFSALRRRTGVRAQGKLFGYVANAASIFSNKSRIAKGLTT